MRFILNGKPVTRDIRADESLLELLRECGCKSVRSGCDTSNCGICTVWVDEKPILSCSYPAARADGKTVTTIEGVREPAEPLMRAFAEEGADQCGFCSPGLLMTILAMKKELKDPTDEEIGRYLAGNLCRCTGYTSQLRAIRRYLGTEDKGDE